MREEEEGGNEESMSKRQALLDISAFSHSGIAQEPEESEARKEEVPKTKHDIVEMLARSGNQFAKRLKLERRNAN